MRSFVLPITFVLTALLLPAASWAQNATVTGRVTTQTQMPIAGASVTIPRLQLSARTNDAGVYRLVVPADRATGSDTVLVSRVGFRPSAVPVDLAPGEIVVDVTLTEVAISLEQVVVTGTAGNQERRAQGATVATIDASSIVQTAPIANVQQLIAGRVPGVVVTQATGSSGGTSLIRIRGVSSISLSNEPLIFIDGVKMDNRNVGDFGSIYFGSSISTLNSLQPNDIESIEVVKGPAAATLYGADASAGVIQIITKRGSVGSDRFSQSITTEYTQIRPNFTPPSNFGTCTAALVEPTSVNPLCQGQPVGTIVEDNPIVREGLLSNGNAKSIN